jgi:hypothetical protein
MKIKSLGLPIQPYKRLSVKLYLPNVNAYQALIEMLDESSQQIIQQLLIREYLVRPCHSQARCQAFRLPTNGVRATKTDDIAPIYVLATRLLPKLAISRQNLNYYASLTNFYTIYELKREQTYLYLLCYAWQR